jgi:hypothetical protein
MDRTAQTQMEVQVTTTIDSTDMLTERKIEATRHVLQKVVRIMSGKLIRVHISRDAYPWPAWTDGVDIFLNGVTVRALLKTNPDDFTQLVMKLWGLTYHELSHILHSPRKTDDVHRRVL